MFIRILLNNQKKKENQGQLCSCTDVIVQMIYLVFNIAYYNRFLLIFITETSENHSSSYWPSVLKTN